MDKLDKSLSDIIGSNRGNGKIKKGRTKYRSAPYSKKRKGGGNQNCRVYVGNLLYETQWQELKDHMRSAGDVVKADIIMQGSRSSGSAVVTFETAAGAAKAIEELHDSDLEGRKIFVREDREPLYQGGGSSGGFNQKNFGGGGFDEPVFSARSNLSQKIRANAGPGCCVFIGNLPWAAKWQEVKDLCSPFGSVERADVEENADGRSKGFGICVFSNRKAANKCIQQLNGTDYEGRDLEVKLDNKTYQHRQQGFRGNNNNNNNNSFQQGFMAAQRMMMGFGNPNFGGGQNFGGGGGGGGRGGGVRVFVGNLPFSAEWQELKDMGKEYGDVVRADIMQTQDGRSAGYGILTFRNKQAANACIQQLHGSMCEGRDLTVHLDKKS